MKQQLVLLALLLLITTSAFAQSKVVVVPLAGKKPTGDATETDVLAGKTFSNISGTDLVGTRPFSPVAKTGQQECYGLNDSPPPQGVVVSCTDTGQDGNFQIGITWPTPRFTDNGNGTVTDGLTGLIWLQDANCPDGVVIRDKALAYAKVFHDGYGLPGALLDCDLSDGSIAGDWRLPNRFELESLLDLSQQGPSLPIGHPFINVQPDYYWTSSYNSYFVDMGVGWAVHFSAGAVGQRHWVLDPNYVWLVRGGQ